MSLIYAVKSRSLSGKVVELASVLVLLRSQFAAFITCKERRKQIVSNYFFVM